MGVVAGSRIHVGSPEHASLVVRALLAEAADATELSPQPSTRTAEAAGLSVEPLTTDEVTRASSLGHQAMVFLNTAEAVQRLVSSLRAAGVHCVQFHKMCSAAEREDSLRRFREGAAHVFVCTDSAARGLDLPKVRQVVQAEFALNVVQHQHRVGRASRAGRWGRATNFVFPSSQALVDSLLGLHAPRTQTQQQTQQQQLTTDWKIVDTDPSDEVNLVQPQHDIDADIASVGGSYEKKPVKATTALRGPPGAGIEQAFSRRRGFRRNLRRQAAMAGDDVTV